MIIDCHGHYTTTPPGVGAWRDAQKAAVAANLDDLPRRVRWARANPEAAAAIARRAQELAASLHVLDVACFWWQLLTATAPLQNFEPRTQSALGFAPAQRG